jgi:histidine triad (HIT) family protein
MTKLTAIDMEKYNELASSDCFICRIVAGRPLIPGVHVVDEDDFTITFLSQFPTKEGYTLVCPKNHIERYEADMSSRDWQTLQKKVHQVSRAVAKALPTKRLYEVSWGSPERNSHLHIHICPCPEGTLPEDQQIAAMDYRKGYLKLDDAKMSNIAQAIKSCL